MMRQKYLGITLALLLVANVVVAGELNQSDKKAEFQLGVYFNSNSHPANLQVSRMMADLARHGFTRVVAITYPYMQFAPQGFHKLAKDWGIEIYIGNISNPMESLSFQENDMKALIDLVNSYPDSDAVKGWYAADEVEFFYKVGKHDGVEEKLRDFVSLIHKLDPHRKVIVNHDARNQAWGGFMDVGEDESWCSVFFANRFARKHLQRVKKEMRDVSEAPLTTVYGAQSTNKFMSQKELPTMGLEGRLEDVKKIPTRKDIADYILTSHKLGMDGVSFFVYDGYYDYYWYSLVDERGRSKEGKMEGILDAMRQIRKDEGWPGIRLNVHPLQGRKIRIETQTVSNRLKVQKTEVEISFDGGYTWKKIEGFGADGGKVVYQIPYSWQRANWSMIRARCFDGKHHSMWAVWNIYPNAKPNPS